MQVGFWLRVVRRLGNLKSSSCSLFPGCLIQLTCDTAIWPLPFEVDVNASCLGNLEKDSFGIVIAHISHERLVLVGNVLGWVNWNYLKLLLPT